jgi:hypothetical protein
MKEVVSKTGPLGPECFENDLPDRTDEEIAALHSADFNARIDATPPERGFRCRPFQAHLQNFLRHCV